MEAITKKIYGLRIKFNNYRIFNNCTKIDLSLEELESVDSIIKKERKDGVYEIGDDLVVVLDNGIVTLKDADNEC